MTQNNKNQHIDIKTSMKPRHRVEIIQIVHTHQYIRPIHEIEILTTTMRDGINSLKNQSFLSEEEAVSAKLYFDELSQSFNLISSIPDESQGFFYQLLKNNFDKMVKLDFKGFVVIDEINAKTYLYLQSVKRHFSGKLTEKNISLLISIVSALCITQTNTEILKSLKKFLDLLCIIGMAIAVLPDDTI